MESRGGVKAKEEMEQEEEVHLPECLRNVNTRLCFHRRLAESRAPTTRCEVTEEDFFFFDTPMREGRFRSLTDRQTDTHTCMSADLSEIKTSTKEEKRKKRGGRRIDFCGVGKMRLGVGGEKGNKNSICLNNYQKSLASF